MNYKRTRPVQRREVTEREIQAQMMTPPVMAALNIGLQVGGIKQVIKAKLEQTGCGFSTADAVIEAALNLQLDDDDFSNEISDSNISQEVTRILTNAIEQTLSNNEINSVASETPRPNPEPVIVANASISSDPSDIPFEVEKTISLEEENRLLREARLCKICMDKEVGIVFLPCGHFATCINCAPNLQDCPVCRSTIKATVRTFLS